MDPNFVKAVEAEDNVLDDSVEEDGPKPGSTAVDCTGTSGGLSLSFRDESMRMERLLGSICQSLQVCAQVSHRVHESLDDGLLVGQVAKKSSTRQQVSVLSSWMEAWNILHSNCAQTALELVKYQHIICQLFARDGSSLEPVPSRLTTTPAGTTPPSGGHGACHPQVLGPRLWWRALCQGLAMCCTSGPVISMNSHHFMPSELTTLYEQQAHTTLRPAAHTTLRPASSHHSTTSELTPLYKQQAHTTLRPEFTPLCDQQAHTTLRPANSPHSMTSELTPLYDQRAHTTLRPASSHHSMTSELTPLYDQRAHTTLRPVKLTPLYDQRAHTTLQTASSYHSTTSSSHHSTTSELTPFYD
ncbi:hypothetical protein EMCRGX_G010419 [Ephydatia muelleri]